MPEIITEEQMRNLPKGTSVRPATWWEVHGLNVRLGLILALIFIGSLLWNKFSAPTVEGPSSYDEAFSQFEQSSDEWAVAEARLVEAEINRNQKRYDHMVDCKNLLREDYLPNGEIDLKKNEHCNQGVILGQQQLGLEQEIIYATPYDLTGGHLNYPGVRITQTSYGGSGNEPEAFDVGFGPTPEHLRSAAEKLYFPDWNNQEIEWLAEDNLDFGGVKKDWGKYCGSFISLRNMDHNIGYIICHAKLGEGIISGSTGLHMGQWSDTGKQSGPHTHYEPYKYDELSDTWFNVHYVKENWHDRNDKVIDINEDHWYISSYYTPVRGQKEYFNGSYEADFNMNCHGDCLSTASGYRLTQEDKYQVVACPTEYPLGTRFNITLPNDHPQYPNKSWDVTCVDRGGAIRSADTNKTGQNQLDLWSGIGAIGESYPWIGEMSTKKAKVTTL